MKKIFWRCRILSPRGNNRIVHNKINQFKGYSYPYFYANLLIYPAYEFFFSIIRKIINKKGPYQPDQKHLHHLIQRIYQLKYNYNLTKSKIYSAISINFFLFYCLT